jgi:Glycogen recognition site of AMP-activated protein kinase
MTTRYHHLVAQLLDGELSLAELPPELRAEGEEALRVLGVVDRTPVVLSESLDARVMATVRRHAASPARRAWRWLTTARDFELRLRVRPWTLSAGALAAAAAVAVIVARASVSPGPVVAPVTAVRQVLRDSVYVRFVLYAPGAKHVAVAGTFNQWDQQAAPLVPAGASGVWSTTLAIPVGQHQYAFVVDGRRWVADPAAPGVDDGFGHRNSVVAVTAQGARTL